MTIINNLAKDLVLDQELCTLLTKDVMEAVNPLTHVRGVLLSLIPRAIEDGRLSPNIGSQRAQQVHVCPAISHAGHGIF